MTPEAVDKMLENYRENKARCEYLQKTMDELREIVRSAKATMRADASNGVQVLTGMPHGSGTSDPTGRYGLLFASGWMPQDMQEIEAEIAKYQEEYDYKIISVVLTEKILTGLTSKEHLIVHGKYIDGLTWRELADRYSREFAVYISPDSLRRMNKDAKQKLYRIAQ